MTCDYIVQYVRALQNEAGSNIKTLYRILDDRVEALEFTVHEKSRATGVPLSQLHLKKTCCSAASPAATRSRSRAAAMRSRWATTSSWSRWSTACMTCGISWKINGGAA